MYRYLLTQHIMLQQPINKLFPFKKLIKLLLILSVCLQIIVISQVYFFGNKQSHTTNEIIIHFIRATSLTTLGLFLLSYPNLFLINYLNRVYPWKGYLFKRFAIQFPVSIFIGILITPLILFLASKLMSFEEDLYIIFINNAYYFSLANLFLMVIFEAWIYLSESLQAKIKAENLERELISVKFEVLKNQINPHFMFNSLNVLSSLIETDVEKAQRFVEEFSQIYRYVLDTIEKPVVSVNDELSFVRSYVFLQQIRHGESLVFDVDIPAECLGLLLPPLSLQVVLENAIKHNKLTHEQPLKIEISIMDDALIVSNNIQPKISLGTSTGLGQTNLTKRYDIISDRAPKFTVQMNQYIVELPLIKSFIYECDNY